MTASTWWRSRSATTTVDAGAPRSWCASRTWTPPSSRSPPRAPPPRASEWRGRSGTTSPSSSTMAGTPSPPRTSPPSPPPPFNGRHPDPWVGEPHLHPALAATGLTFTAGTRDSGSDDLQMLWDFDDGTQITTTHYNDGVAPDPLKSPFGVFPFSASSVVTHAY